MDANQAEGVDVSQRAQDQSRTQRCRSSTPSPVFGIYRQDEQSDR
jgi:hypothetical protein